MNGSKLDIGESAEYVPLAGAEWLVSASDYPRSLRALWSARPWAPSVLPCGTKFDVVNAPELYGRRVLDELWSAGPGCGPVAALPGRLLVFARPGTADRLRTLLSWGEWSAHIPPLLFHGPGDAVTVPPLCRLATTPSRWVIAPDTIRPQLPDSGDLLRACVRSARAPAASRQIDF